MLIQIPKGADVFELPSSKFWVDKEGIVYSVSKPVPASGRNNDELRNEMERIRTILGNKKVCIIMESSRTVPPPKSQRDLIASELNSIVKALAIVSSSPLNRMVANLFFAFKPPQFPMRMFSNEKEAKDWIRQYL